MVQLQWENDEYMDELNSLMEEARKQKDIFAILKIDEEMKRHLKEKKEHRLLFET